MATLTETAYYTRRTINWIVLGVMAYIILRMVWWGVTTAYTRAFPPKPAPPNHALGVLPKIVFPQNQTAATPSYRLETIEGTVPVASGAATVYFMPKKPANLLALTQTQTFASKLGLSPAPIQETKNIYRFDDKELMFRRLRYDIVSDNFILRYAFEQDLSVFAEHNIPEPEQAIQLAKNMLTSNNLMKNDFAGGKPAVTFLRSTADTLAETTSLSQADAIRIDFFRKPVGQLPVVTPLPKEGLIAIVYSGSSNAKKQLLQFAYTYWPIDLENNGTYELKTSNDAWSELTNGGGYIASIKAGVTDVVIRSVTLAYYDSFDPQMYLQPVFVFEGDEGFIAYVPAVAAQWVE